MMIRNLLLGACLLLLPTSVVSDCMDETPVTFYETAETTAGYMDYDTENNIFLAHSAFLNDTLVHYYKFHTYAPNPNWVKGLLGSVTTTAGVHTQKIYLITTTGDFDGVIGGPIIEYHTIDGALYSDFMTLHFVTVPDEYTGNPFTNTGDLETSGFEISKTSIVFNMPVVPTGSFLQHPIAKGRILAPIQPVLVWYKCVQVWTYLFDVTHETAATFFSNLTRPLVHSPTTDGYQIAVSPDMGPTEENLVNAIPLWHLNQYTRGVVEGTGGGSNSNGMRNVFHLDRNDPGYSPLRQVTWNIGLPIDYTADEATSASVMSTTNGFVFLEDTAMFVNCPMVGPRVEFDSNIIKKSSFAASISIQKDTAWVMGSVSNPNLIFVPGMSISFVAGNGTVIGSTTTSLMGSYEFELDVSKLPNGTSYINIMSEEKLLRTISVTEMDVEVPSEDSTEEEDIDVDDADEDGSSSRDGLAGNDGHSLSASGFGIIIAAACVGGVALFVVLAEGLCNGPVNKDEKEAHNEEKKHETPEQPRV